MKKINLIKRQKITIDEFRSWLAQLIQDKKGALPDLDDWKLIKEQLDRVSANPQQRDMFDDGSGYCICQDDEDGQYAFACGGEPYDMQFTIDLLDRLCAEADEELYRNIKTIEGEANNVLAANVREMNKEYDNGETKTNTRETTTTSNP
ncbi:MAG: hypothetical protein KGI25_09825 [Thaumarchaeota archaeon]|nr:hypothetical protein [Nitrososphaerota archaeon]